MFLFSRQIQTFIINLLFCLVHGEELCPYAECVCITTLVWCNETVTGIPTLRTGEGVKKVTSVLFSRNQIKNIPEDSLPSGLTDFGVIENPILYIDPSAFKESTSTLEDITFFDALFTELPEALLTLDKLHYFSLGNVTIKTWNNTILAHMGQTLQSLSFNNVDMQPWTEHLKFFPLLRVLNIEYVSLTDIPRDTFALVKDNLKMLTIQNTNLSQIPKALSVLKNVKLTLARNNIERLDNMPEVTYLDLSHNLLSDANNVAQALQISVNSLYTLDLSFNQLISIPNLSSFSALRTLYLDHNNIVSDSAPILQNSVGTLESLSISFNQLTSIPNISSLPFLTFLSLHNNNITNPTSDLQQTADRLETLILSFNQLTSISNLPRSRVLKSLSLEHNKLSDLSLDQLQILANSLQTLSLSFNHLTVIPNLSNFSTLRSLHLDFNKISDSMSVSLPSSLSLLELQGNRLTSIPTAIASIDEYLTLNLSSNFITEFNSTNIPNKTWSLDLSSNQITALGNNSFPEHCILQELYLQSNPINFIAAYAFANVKGLETLDLSKTLLTSLPLALSSLSFLNDLVMNDISTLKCTCPVPKTLLQWFINSPPYYQIEGDCTNTNVSIASAFYEETIPNFECQIN